MSEYIKYFDNGGKNMSFKNEDDNILVKHDKIWNRIKKKKDKKKSHSKPVYEEENIKAKVKTFNEVVNSVFSVYELPKESIHYICIAAISTDSVMEIDKKNYPHVYLEECTHKIKKKKMTKLIKAELKLVDSDDSNCQ